MLRIFRKPVIWLLWFFRRRPSGMVRYTALRIEEIQENLDNEEINLNAFRDKMYLLEGSAEAASEQISSARSEYDKSIQDAKGNPSELANLVAANFYQCYDTEVHRLDFLNQTVKLYRAAYSRAIADLRLRTSKLTALKAKVSLLRTKLSIKSDIPEPIQKESIDELLTATNDLLTKQAIREEVHAELTKFRVPGKISLEDALKHVKQDLGGATCSST